MGTSKIMVRDRHMPLFIQHDSRENQNDFLGGKRLLKILTMKCNSKILRKLYSLVNGCGGETQHFHQNYTSPLLSFIPKDRRILFKAAQWKYLCL